MSGDYFESKRREFPLCEVTSNFYENQRDCVPPMRQVGMAGFCVGEFYCGPIVAQFLECDGRFFGAYVDWRNRETWVARGDVAALLEMHDGKPPVFEWYGRRANAD